MTNKVSKKPKAEPIPMNTLYVDRMLEALALLCGGKRPDREMVVAWEDNSSEALQDWAMCNTSIPWATGIGTIESAQAMAETPEEGTEHQCRSEAFPSVRAVAVPCPAAELSDLVGSAFGEGWNLTMSGSGQGALSSSSGILYFGSAAQLDNCVHEALTSASTAS